MPQKFDNFDKHHIIRGAVRQIQKFLYLNEPGERKEWFHDSDSSGHMIAMTYAGEGAWEDRNKS